VYAWPPAANPLALAQMTYNQALRTDKGKLSCLYIRSSHATSLLPLSLLVKRHPRQFAVLLSPVLRPHAIA
jgi:hypothetical protein